jgi:2-dehydro-3-deoxyphosphogluconate aldolase/(4S)-4-hydroxy-2-oxoglutarate aldolase
MLSPEVVFERISQYGVVPVIALESAHGALRLADALWEGGLPIVEITFRTEAAAEAIRRIVQHRPEMLVGAGTLLRPEQVEAARASGAQFGVAPGLSPQVLRRAQELKMPFLPGVATASEIEQALSLGCRWVKYFPAEAMGGVKMLQALWGPFAHTGLRFLPTGGISEANLAQYIALRCVAAVGGTWIAKSDEIAAGRWTEITQRCQNALRIVAQTRSAAAH